MRRAPLPVRVSVIAITALGCLLPVAGAAIDTVSLSIETLAGPGWSAEDVEVRLLAGDDGALAASVHIARARLPEPLGQIGPLRLRCDSVTVDTNAYRCEQASTRVTGSLLEDRTFPLQATYHRQSGRISVATPSLHWQGLTLALDADWTEAGWRATVRSAPADVALVYAGLRSIADDLPTLELSDGRVSLQAEASGDELGLERLSARLKTAGLGFSNETGTLATDGLDTDVELELQPAADADDVRFTLAATANAGEAYAEPVYLDLGAAGLELHAAGRLETSGRLELSSLTLTHRDTLTLSGSAVIAAGETVLLETADIEIREAVFPGVYTGYLQGYLTGTPLARLETAGRVHGAVKIDDGRLASLRLSLEDVSADDRQERLALYGLRGDIVWNGPEATEPGRSRLAWNGGFVYSLGFGAADAALVSEGRRLALERALRIPVADGALVIETLEARGLGGEDPELAFDARLEPISLSRITTALGWPALPGKLSGELPLLSLSEGELTVGGELNARVFDGTVRIGDLRIERPFGTSRRTSADVTLDNLDLALITDVFTFGRIEGRLDGAVRDLEMLQGRPIAFDAGFYTPSDDDSRHRISRRALNNLSEIAGAGTALLSTGFLSLFQEFRYDSLGISCALQGDVCRMGGIRPAENGYYLVKGSGLPRIDVIGHSREVNWPRLVAQIAEALRSREVSTTPQSEEPK